MGANDSKPLPPLSANDIIRFWSKVDIRGPEECWPWTANTTWGYGQFSLGPKVTRRMVRSNRVAYFLKHGVDAYPLAVCHTCDNPPCCNADHFFLGTGEENTADKTNKGRAARGEKHGRVKLTVEQVLEIRRRYAAGGVFLWQLGKEYNVDFTCISMIVRRKNWAWLP